MKAAVYTAIGALAALVAAAPVVAKDPVLVVAAAVKDKPTFALNPAKAYILIRSDTQMSLTLMKIPTAEEIADYNRRRAEKLAKARATYTKRLAEYEEAKSGKAPAFSHQTKKVVPPKPVEPTDYNLPYAPLLMRTMVSIGPIFRFAKSKEDSTYLHEVTPGDYRIYGPIAVTPNAVGSM